MKKTKIFAAIGGIGLVVLSIFLVSADHIDAPAVEGTKSDIADFYAFQGENTNNLVFVTNVQGLITPENTNEAEFDENVLIEINIDNDNDLVEDLVIQAIKRKDTMFFFGPAQPLSTGLDSEIITAALSGKVTISNADDDVITSEQNGMKFFAGPREDPFFFDFDQYNRVLAGSAPDGFNDPGVDTFAGTNVLSVVVEVPKSMLGNGVTGVNPFAPDTPMYNVWVETKRKQ